MTFTIFLLQANLKPIAAMALGHTIASLDVESVRIILMWCK